MDALEARIAKLEAIEDIKRLKQHHIELTDAGYLVDALVDLWCEDGTWLGVFTDIDDPLEAGSRGQTRYHGHDEIRRFWELNGRLYDFVLHVMIPLDIRVNDDLETATGTWKWLMPSTRDVDGVPTATWLGGTQSDEYRRVDGVWKFYTVQVHADLVATHLGGWVPSRYIEESPV
ncbi:nuclear transport factor 2 family protein [Embleya hyalina]|uniref:nuclear transport factor 2 family protein n=1 Tax=Embleya hyalina TaxID=516124 RepID=UPI00135B48EB|nr:nuclear transport factor 2 family protein [Embleya hyalina]